MAEKVVWPLGRLVYSPISIASRPSDLKGKTICELSDYAFKSEYVFPLLRMNGKTRSFCLPFPQLGSTVISR